jgi:hypothetical protein
MDGEASGVLFVMAVIAFVAGLSQLCSQYKIGVMDWIVAFGLLFMSLWLCFIASTPFWLF